MGKRVVLIVVLLGFLFFVCSLVSSSIPGEISSCQKLNVSGVYFLTEDIEGLEVNLSDSEVGCFNISVSNVTLNCNGHSISNMTLNKIGIFAGPRITNVTILNCNVTLCQ
jgi:hypothetical protein